MAETELGLKVIPPPSAGLANNEQREALRLLDEIGNRILPKQNVRSFLLEAIRLEREDNESVRKIQANRFEVFVQDAVGKKTNALDLILKTHGLDVESTKKCIVDYAIQQAKKDQRLKGEDVKFSNFSLILSYGQVEGQAPHIDLLEPNFQFGLILTAGPGTVAYQKLQKIKTVKDLCDAWDRIDAMDGTGPIPQELVGALNQSKDASNTISGYGSVLIADEEIEAAAEGHDDLPLGTILSLPGSIVHAGPKHDKFRAVLFFTAWPKQHENIEEYHPDTQYSSVFLCGRLAQMIWRHPQMEGNSKARKYLLRKLYRHIRQGGATPKHKRIQRDWASHFPEWDSFVDFIYKLEKDRTTRQEDFRLITKAAQDETLIFYNVMGSQNDQSSTGDFVKVSVPGLQTTWDDRNYEVRVFQRPSDKKVLLYYPDDGSQTGYSWEGARPEDSYRLDPLPIMKVGVEDTEWFNGTNGRLVDSDGVAVECHRASAESQTLSNLNPEEQSNNNKRKRDSIPVSNKEST